MQTTQQHYALHRCSLTGSACDDPDFHRIYIPSAEALDLSDFFPPSPLLVIFSASNLEQYLEKGSLSMYGHQHFKICALQDPQWSQTLYLDGQSLGNEILA